jgi:hypothetical protein
MMRDLVPLERIEREIFLIRGHKVMIDASLAALYGVDVGQLTRQVRRNQSRFPADFSFQLTPQEWKSLKCQTGISRSWGGRRHSPYVFTEQGVSMLSSVLNSKRAISVNIAIMRAFVRLREIMATHVDLARKIDELEKKFQKHDAQFVAVFDAIRQLIRTPRTPAKKIGFRPEISSRAANILLASPIKRRYGTTRSR